MTVTGQGDVQLANTTVKVKVILEMTVTCQGDVQLADTTVKVKVIFRNDCHMSR